MTSLQQFSFQNQFHVLRHFSNVDDEYQIELLKNTNYSEQNITDQMAMSGSKFHPELAKNPGQLWENIQKHPDFVGPSDQDWVKNRFVVALTFQQLDFAEGIGNDSLIYLDDLKANEYITLLKKNRDGHLVNQIQVNNINPTWQLNVIFCSDPQPFVKTIFPGIYAPPFPDAVRQSDSEFTKNTSFWEQHAIVV
jgi:hypothetical protein